MSSSLKHELADHIYQYLCHEAQYSDLPEAAKESLTAASECIEQAYRLNVSSNQHSSGANSKANDGIGGQQQQSKFADILPDELLRIFTRHKEFLSQQKDSLIHQLRNTNRDEATSTSNEKPDIRVNNNIFQAPNNMNDHQNNSNNSTNNNSNTTNMSNMSPTLTNSNNSPSLLSSQIASSSTATNQQQQQSSITTTATKHHNQHPISQLPMTTRKKLSHLRAQIKRQASKAARSRLEKRSSVSGVGSSNIGGGGDKSGHFGVSGDLASTTKHQAGDGHHHHHHHNKELHNQPNSSSSTESPSAYLGHHQSASSSTAAGACSNSADTNTNTNMSPTLNNESGPGLGGPSNAKLVGQHSLAAPGGHHASNHHHHSIHQKNFKQKIIALLKKFRTDGSDFDSEEQYREALERELIKAAAGRGSRAIEELLEEDIDVEEESGSEPEGWDNISESSTPKPSLRPFFSSTTLDKI